MKNRNPHEIEPREQAILQAIVQDYIATAAPVSSRALVRRHRLKVSPATVRNVMADLAELGLITQPHASAGRVPTDLGYRLYVDTLLSAGPGPPAAAEAERLVAPLEEVAAEGVEALLASSSRLLSGLTHHVGVVSAPCLGEMVLEHLELVRLDGNRILAILVSRSHYVQNRIFHVEEPLSDAELTRINRRLNQQLAGLTLEEARARAARELRETRESYYRLILEAVRDRRLTLEGATHLLFLEGQSALLDQPEFEDVERARELLAALEERQALLALLDRVVEAEGVQVFIGAETTLGESADVSVVAMQYGIEGRVLGAVGVIGPRRMDYSRIIPLVELTSRAVERKLTSV